MPEWIPDIFKAVVSPEWIAGIIKAVIIAAFASFLTVHLAIRRFHKEKWWEKKQEIYSRLLETLHHLKYYAAEHYENQINPNYLTDEKRVELTKDWKKFSREFKMLIDLASFHLSAEGVAVLDEYEKKAACKSNDLFEWIDEDLVAISKCIEELKRAAKHDLKVK